MPIDWHKKGSPITAAVAALALVVGGLNAVSAIVVERSASHQVCQDERNTNAAMRGLLSDFIEAAKPPVTPAQKLQAEAIALRRFPVVTC